MLFEVTGFTKAFFLAGDKVAIAEQERIAFEMEKVKTLDFIQMNAKLVSYHGWSVEKILEAEDLYKKWLVLHQVYGESLVLAPNDLVDEYWHTHILDTRKYMDDCQKVLGYYLHHYPYFGLTEGESEEALEAGFELTQKLFKTHFGHDIVGHNNRCGPTSCR
ncbi:MAG: hypothetical protein GXO35_08080 [Gammaproteobacteria bacterium]|nr:hypothetical protein [Gammaproteobacteria bacterium]